MGEPGKSKKITEKQTKVDDAKRLAKKYNVSLSTTDSGSDSNSDSTLRKDPPKQKKKVLTKKKPRKSRDSSEESEDDSMKKQKLFSNPFFVNDNTEKPCEEPDEENEKDKLVEMLYSLIKKEKSNTDPSPAKKEEDIDSVEDKIEVANKKIEQANREKDLEQTVSGKTKE